MSIYFNTFKRVNLTGRKGVKMSVRNRSVNIAVMGAAYGTAKSSVGISAMAVMRPELMMKSIIPVIMAGIIAIYGLVVSFVLNGRIQDPANGGYTLHQLSCFC
jgi:ATP synthase proteolipid subunit